MNLIRNLQKQIESGNSIIDKKGNVVSLEKLQKTVSKEYAKLVQKSEINPMDISFSDFFYSTIEDYLVVEEVIAFITGDGDSEEPLANKESEVETEN